MTHALTRQRAVLAPRPWTLASLTAVTVVAIGLSGCGSGTTAASLAADGGGAHNARLDSGGQTTRGGRGTSGRPGSRDAGGVPSNGGVATTDDTAQTTGTAPSAEAASSGSQHSKSGSGGADTGAGLHADAAISSASQACIPHNNECSAAAVGGPTCCNQLPCENGVCGGNCRFEGVHCTYDGGAPPDGGSPCCDGLVCNNGFCGTGLCKPDNQPCTSPGDVCCNDDCNNGTCGG